MRGYGFVCFARETYNEFFEMYKQAYVTKKCFIDFEECVNYNQLLKLIEKHFMLNDDFCKLIHWHCYVILPEWKYANRSQSTTFNDCQNRFWQMLMKNNGIITREKLRDRDNGLTNQQIDSHVSMLVEMKLIFAVKTRRNMGGNTIYVVHPEYVNEVKNE